MLSLFIHHKSKQRLFWDACCYGREKFVRELLAAGVDVDKKSYEHKYFPIHVASQGKPIVLKLLLEAGCQVDVVDAEGNTALHHAVMAGRYENVEMLLAAGANINAVNKNGWTPIFNSVYWNHPAVTQLLLQHDSDPLIKNKDGRNALHELCRSKSRDSDGLLSNFDALLGFIHEASASCSNELSIINMRADLQNEFDSEADFTPLLFACYHGHLELVKILLDNGADIHAIDKNHWTALHWAAERCHADIVELLLDHGASRLSKDLRGEMPFCVTNDLGLRDCLLPDLDYPQIMSNGYVTTDDEDDDAEEDKDEIKERLEKPQIANRIFAKFKCDSWNPLQFHTFGFSSFKHLLNIQNSLAVSDTATVGDNLD